MTNPNTDTNLTPYIAVAANYFGTGKSAQEARKNLAKAGGSPQEPQTVYKLPDGAFNAFVSQMGDVHWAGVEGEMRPVFRYVNGKAVAWSAGEDTPVPFKKMTAKTKPLAVATEGSEAPTEVEAGDGEPDKESTIAATTVGKPKRPSRKPAKVVEPEVAAESAQEPADPSPAAAPVKAKRPSKKPAPAIEAASEAPAQAETQPEVVTAPAPAPAAPAPTAKKAKPTAAPTTAATPAEAADFLLFIGGSFYTKDVFIAEAASMGISRRMPSHRLPKGLVCGTSKVYVATDGGRKTDGTPLAEVFGYFIPGQVQFVQGADKTQFTDIIASLKVRKDTKIIGDTSKEPERACGTRQLGGTYLVVDKADSPLKLLAKPAHYVGNHFRGMLRLNDLQARQFNTGGTVVTLVDETCMKCGGAMKCAPDGHARAERERKRIEKGQEPKWLLLDANCQKEVRAARAADDGPQSAAEDQGDPSEGTD